MNTVTYHNPNASPPWIAAVLLNGKPWLYHQGLTEQAAKDAAEAFFIKEKARQAALKGEEITVDDRPSETVNRPIAPSVGKVEGRGHHFAGKTWMRDAAGTLSRVPNELVDEYLAKGYRKSGPRSK